MTVDEILADPAGALNIEDGEIPIAIVVLLEYADPGSDNFPGRTRISMNCDDNTPPWKVMGMCQYAIGHELAAIAEQRKEDNE